MTGKEQMTTTVYGAVSSPILCSRHSDANGHGSMMQEGSGGGFLGNEIEAATIGSNLGSITCIDFNNKCAKTVFVVLLVLVTDQIEGAQKVAYFQV